MSELNAFVFGMVMLVVICAVVAVVIVIVDIKGTSKKDIKEDLLKSIDREIQKAGYCASYYRYSNDGKDEALKSIAEDLVEIKNTAEKL